MSEIFRRMNAAIRVKKLDPMDLKLLSKSEEEKDDNKNKKGDKSKNKAGIRLNK